MKKNIEANVELTKQGFSGYIEINNSIIVAQGDTIEELKEDFKSALNLYLEELQERGVDIKAYKNYEIDIILDVKALFKVLKPINVSGFASYSGMNRSLLGQYLTGKKRPSEKQSRKILENVHKLGEQLASINY
jgi:predicted RNase H-like HicB family nuclease